MFTDEHRCDVLERIRQQDMRAFAKHITPAVLQKQPNARPWCWLRVPCACRIW